MTRCAVVLSAAFAALPAVATTALFGCAGGENYATYNPCLDGDSAVAQCALDAQLTGTYPAVDNIMQSRHIGVGAVSPAPGCAVGLMSGGKVVYVRAYGMAELDPPDDNVFTPPTGRPWTLATMSPIGSASKTLTALTLLKLLRARTLPGVALDDMTDGYLLSDLVPAVPAALSSTSITSMLTHNSGLPNAPTYGDDYDDDGQLRATIKDAWDQQYADAFPGIPLEYHPTLQPRSTYWGHKDADAAQLSALGAGAASYSNAGFRILGAAIDFQTIDIDQLFDPDNVGGAPNPASYMDMARSGVAYQGGYEQSVRATHNSPASAAPMPTMCLRAPWRDEQIGDMSRGYAYVAGSGFDPFEPAPQTDLWSVRHASGGWMMSIGDLTRLMVQMESGEILNAADITVMSTGTTVDINNGRNYGMGVWPVSMKLSDGNTYPGYEHPGQVHGFSAIYRVIEGPNGAIGAAMMCNVKNPVSVMQSTVRALITQLDADLAPPATGVPLTPSPIVLDASVEACSAAAVPATTKLQGLHYDHLFRTWQDYLRRAGGDEDRAADLVRWDLQRDPVGAEAVRRFDAGDLEGAAAALNRMLSR